MDKLAQEFEAVGFYLTGHPLDDYMKPLQKLGVETNASFRDKVLTKGATAAKRELEKLGFTTEYKNLLPSPIGVVYGLDPGAGTMAPKGSKVIIRLA